LSFLFLLPLLAGIGMTSQTAINSRLRYYVNNPFFASMISFLVGTIFLAILTLGSGHSLFVDQQTITGNPWWIWLGGPLGAFLLTMNILLFPKLGSVQATLLPIVGQVVMSLLIDQFGFFQSTVHRVSGLGLLGLVLVLIGMLFSINYFQQKTAKQATSQSLLHWRVLGILGGMAFACQSSINGKLGGILGLSQKSAFYSFLLGTLILIIVVLCLRLPLKQSFKGVFTGFTTDWWCLLGGLIGAINVFMIAWLSPKIGTALTLIVLLVGQLGFSLVLEHFGLFKSPKKATKKMQVMGLLLMIIGIGMIHFL
jgi:Uncharacterized protein conserved in bacteria